MVIDEQNIKNIDSLKDRLKKGARSAALRDIVSKSYEFFEFIAADDQINLDFINENIPLNVVGNHILTQMVSAAKIYEVESFVLDHCKELISFVTKYKYITIPDEEINLYDEIDLCNCLLIIVWAREVGIQIETQELLILFEARKVEPSAVETTFEVPDSPLPSNTVAAAGSCYGYRENDVIYLMNGRGVIRELSAKNALCFQIDGDGGVVYLKSSCGSGKNTVVALSDEEYPTATAVALSIRDFQFAYILEDRTLKTNIPFARSISAKGLRFKKVCVSKNQLLAITEDDRVFSSDHGLLEMHNVRKATAGQDGQIVYLTTNGEVYMSQSGRCIAKNVLDVDYCAKGLVMRFQEHISLWKDGRMNMLIEDLTQEMAVSDTGIVYRIKDGSVHICEFDH